MPPRALTSSFQMSIAISAALPLPASGPVRLMPKPIFRGCCARAGSAPIARAAIAHENQANGRFIEVSSCSLSALARATLHRGGHGRPEPVGDLPARPVHHAGLREDVAVELVQIADAVRHA